MPNIIESAGKTAFQLAYQYSPIILTNGLAQSIPGNMLPIIAITQAANFNLGILNGTNPFNPGDLFANFRPLPGGTLIDYDIGNYPFANQAIAANAIIAQPLKLSMLMNAPVNQPGAYVSKLVTFSALKAVLDTHANLGGTYTVNTPSFIYRNMILLQMRDVSPTNSQQAQSAWQLDFVKPLLTQEQATTALGNLMSKIAGKLPITSTSWSGVGTAILNG